MEGGRRHEKSGVYSKLFYASEGSGARGGPWVTIPHTHVQMRRGSLGAGKTDRGGRESGEREERERGREGGSQEREEREERGREGVRKGKVK